MVLEYCAWRKALTWVGPQRDQTIDSRESVTTMSAAIAINQGSQTVASAGRAVLSARGAEARVAAPSQGGARSALAMWCKAARIPTRIMGCQSYVRHDSQFKVTLTGRLPVFEGFPGRVGRQGSG